MDNTAGDHLSRQNTENMLFGNRADFAIEAGVDRLYRRAVWGHACVWCGGHRLGDIDDPHCALYGPMCGFKGLIEGLDGLWDDRFAGRSGLEIWNFLDAVLYGCHGDVVLEDEDLTAEEAIAQRKSWLWSRFDFLTNWEEMFDGYKSFIVHPPGNVVRILSRSFPSEAGLAVEVTFRAVIDACTAFVAWFDGQQLLANELAAHESQ